MQDKITIKLNGEERELFMSFGLLNELATIVGDPARVPSIPVDADLREAVLMSCFAERKPSGKVIKDVEDYDDLDISIPDVEKTIDWAVEHLMSFFVRSLKKVVAVTKANEGDLKDLASFLAGSNASVSETA